jgi:hypothetical protein
MQKSAEADNQISPLDDVTKWRNNKIIINQK